MKKQKFWTIIDEDLKVPNLGYGNVIIVFFSRADANKTLRELKERSAKDKKRSFKVRTTTLKVLM